jgi:cytochrome b
MTKFAVFDTPIDSDRNAIAISAKCSGSGPTENITTAMPERFRVWDLPTRLFHWTLVVLVCVAVVSKLAEPEWWLPVHLWAGYGIATLVAFRFVWAAYGSRYSRIMSFAYRPREVVEYLRSVVLLRPVPHIGHNPAGAVMIYVLALVLVGLVVTGLLEVGGEEKYGPLAGWASYTVGENAKLLHAILFKVLLAMIAAHVAGVLTASVLHRDNLIGAMLTGWKTLPPSTPIPASRAARPRAAAAMMIVIVGVAAATLLVLSRFGPEPVRSFTWDATYRSECGACHWAYHPSLLPAASWRAVVSGLSDHFGEDASLEPTKAAHIAAWLAANAAETWGTEAANRFRRVDPADPLRITATPYWQRKHAHVPHDAFLHNGVMSKGNCTSCHDDANSGRFDDRAIHMPKGYKK